MQTLPQFLRHILDNLDKYALASSAAAILGGAAVASHSFKVFMDLLALRREKEAVSIAKRYRTVDEAYAPEAIPPSQVARTRALARLDEVKLAMRARRGSARLSRISSNLLTVGQYIVGGVLASSFVQESLSPKSVGLLGILVLIASLVKQHFHPELKAEDARQKASRLQALIRTSEDQLTILDAKIASGQDHSDALIALMTQITKRLNEIEDPEAIK